VTPVDIHGRDPAEPALHAYVSAIAEDLGVPPEHTSCDAVTPATAYIGFDRCAPALPLHDLALVWDERLGWAAAVQTPTGGELIPVSYLGTSAVPPVQVVTRFITDLVAGRERGQHQPPCFGPCADLPGELTAARGAGPPSVPRPRVPSR
jgi:hypothetical protein